MLSKLKPLDIGNTEFCKIYHKTHIITLHIYCKYRSDLIILLCIYISVLYPNLAARSDLYAMQFTYIRNDVFLHEYTQVDKYCLYLNIKRHLDLYDQFCQFNIQ